MNRLTSFTLGYLSTTSHNFITSKKGDPDNFKLTLLFRNSIFHYGLKILNWLTISNQVQTPVRKRIITSFDEAVKALMSSFG